LLGSLSTVWYRSALRSRSAPGPGRPGPATVPWTAWGPLCRNENPTGTVGLLSNDWMAWEHAIGAQMCPATANEAVYPGSVAKQGTLAGRNKCPLP